MDRTAWRRNGSERFSLQTYSYVSFFRLFSVFTFLFSSIKFFTLYFSLTIHMRATDPLARCFYLQYTYIIFYYIFFAVGISSVSLGSIYVVC